MTLSKAVLVTGASRGIGWATAELLCQQGLQVINLDILPQPRASRANHVQVDFTDEAASAKVLKDVTLRYDVTRLVNNAGFAQLAPLEEMTWDLLEKTVQINLRASIQCAQAVLPAMKAAHFGRIVNLTSRAALGKEQRTAYAGTKGALISMTRIWALELARHGITVNAIGPGPVATEMYRAVNPLGSPRTQKLVADIPLGRVGEPEDVAHAIAFFLSDTSSYITGQTLYVCGGLSIGTAPL